MNCGYACEGEKYKCFVGEKKKGTKIQRKKKREPTSTRLKTGHTREDSTPWMEGVGKKI